MLNSSPVAGLQHLKAATISDSAERSALCAEAVQALQIKAANLGPWDALPLIREARQVGYSEASASIAQLHSDMEGRCFSLFLTELIPTLQARQWEAASLMLTGKVKMLETMSEARASLGRLIEISREADPLDRLMTALKSKTPQAWQQVPIHRLPTSLQPSVKALRGLALLRAELAATWDRAPDAAELLATLEEFRAGPWGPAVANSIQLELSCRAFNQGHGTVALALLTDLGHQVDPEQAAARLQEMKRRVLSAPEPASGGAMPTGPPFPILVLTPQTGSDFVVTAQGRVELARPIDEFRAGPWGPATANSVQLDLSGRAFDQGHGTAALALLTDLGDRVDPEQAAARLRDMKRHVLSAPEPASGGATPTGPPFPMLMLTPQNGGDFVVSAQGTSPMGELNVKADLPKTEGTIARNVIARVAAEADTKRDRVNAETRAHSAIKPVTDKLFQAAGGAGGAGAGEGPTLFVVPFVLQNDDEKEKQLLAQLRAELARTLSDDERCLALRLNREGENAEEIRNALKTWSKPKRESRELPLKNVK